MKLVATMVLLCLLGACVPPDQPAHYIRMGRFMGLISSCGCSDIAPDKMLAEYPKALGGHYPAAEVTAMKGYVDLGIGEKWENQTQVCAEVCGQICMVQAVAKPLGGRDTGVQPCLVNERDLHLTDGAQINPGSDN